jgi:DNA polymerase
MDQEREPGRTFAPEDIGWLDFETRSGEDIKAGTYRYMNDADAIICAFALGDGPPRYVAVKDFVCPLAWADMPVDFRAFHDRVMAGTAVWCAWNAGFDKAAWNYGTSDFPFMEAEHIIDAMTQAAVNGLPPSLKMAARAAKVTAKLEEGTDLIKLFCLPESTAIPQSHPQEWRLFGIYALGDIVAMREIFQVTRQLPLAEWREYWAMEKINERGVVIDLDMVKHATWLAHEDKRRSSGLLLELTQGAVNTVDQVKALTTWLLTKLPPEGRDILVKREEELDDDGTVIRPAKYTLTRSKVERLIAYVTDQAPEADAVLKVLQIRLYGGSKSPAKFQKMMAQHVNGTLYGQYVFSGAPQTGRASSKGVQVHNLTRSFLPYEAAAIEAILDNCSYETLATLGDTSPVARKLALLIRPSFVSQETNTFVWSDWANIEARIVPWLCDYLPGAAARVQIFRDIDADPSIPDVYTRTASEISHIPIGEVTKAIRQRGKVAELALGFLGGVGSLLSMGAGYGIHFTDAEAKTIVTNWRAANPWAMQFGDEMWDAMLEAKDNPLEITTVGRINFVFIDSLLGGSMLMQLPSGRFLTYRRLYWDMVPVKDDDDNVIGHQREMTYARGQGRVKLWKGELVNNATQGTAADILRGTLVRLEADGFNIRLHTHDEVLGEVNDQNAEAYSEALRWQMCRGFDWTEGLPIVSEETISPYYSKWESK